MKTQKFALILTVAIFAAVMVFVYACRKGNPIVPVADNKGSNQTNNSAALSKTIEVPGSGIVVSNGFLKFESEDAFFNTMNALSKETFVMPQDDKELDQWESQFKKIILTPCEWCIMFLLKILTPLFRKHLKDMKLLLFVLTGRGNANAVCP